MSEKDPPNLSLVPRPDSKGETLQDPIKLLDLLKNAILRKPVDKDLVSDAIKQATSEYEARNRIFLIAAANAELPRIVRLLSFINQCEEEMYKDERIEDASTRELLKMYALAQSNLMSGLDSVKKVADMRLELLQAAGGADGMKSLFDSDTELNALSDLPGLDSKGRDNVRKVIGGLVESISKDTSVTDNDEDDDPSDDTADQD